MARPANTARNDETRIDTGSRRWLVAVHETAHQVVAEQLGWRVSEVRISESGGSGWMVPHAPRGLDTREEAVQSALISLAGPEASLRGRLLLPAGCQYDLRDARALLRGTGVGFGDARRDARRLVARHWRRIQRDAAPLYRRGTL